MVAIAFMPAPNPYEKLENTAKYVCNWINVTNELKQIMVMQSCLSFLKKKLAHHFYFQRFYVL